MLTQLRGLVSDRKWYLLGIAVWRQSSDRLDNGSKRVIELCEQYAEGAIPLHQLVAATEEAGHFDLDTEPSGIPRLYAREDVSNAFAFANKGVVFAGKRPITGLVRCVLGNPFRTVTFDPVWLAGNDGAVMKIAQASYRQGDFARLPILADALEEAGCDSADIFSHLRGPGPHVRGCWPVDLILGKS
jgi:hypothetical protein